MCILSVDLANLRLETYTSAFALLRAEARKVDVEDVWATGDLILKVKEPIAEEYPRMRPGQVLFTVDFRHPDRQVLARLGDRVEAVCRAHARGCAVEVVETLSSPPTAFSGAVMDLIRPAAARHALPHADIVSGATHDAKHLAGILIRKLVFGTGR